MDDGADSADEFFRDDDFIATNSVLMAKTESQIDRDLEEEETLQSSSTANLMTNTTTSSFILNSLRSNKTALFCRSLLDPLQLRELLACSLSFANFHLITHLDISACNLATREAVDLGANMPQGLISLDVSENHIGSEGASALLSSLTVDSKLLGLAMSQNKISDLRIFKKESEKKQNEEGEGKAMELDGEKEEAPASKDHMKSKKLVRKYTFNTKLAKNSSLKLTSLNLSGNSLTATVFDGDGAVWPNLANLLELNMGWNNLRESGCIKCARVFLNSSASPRNRLQTLELPFNGISTAGGTEISRLLETKKTLLNLDLSRNRLGGECAISFADLLKSHNKTLRTLRLSYNELGVEATKSLVEACLENDSILQLRVENTANLDDIKPTVETVVTAKNKASQKRRSKERFVCSYRFP